MPIILFVMHVRHVASHIFKHAKPKLPPLFALISFKENTRSFLNSLHLHLQVQQLEEKNPFIPSQGFNHFFYASDFSSTSPQEPKARNKK